MKRETLRQLERDLVKRAQEAFGEDLLSVVISGSVATGEIVDGWSDCDAYAIVRRHRRLCVDTGVLSRKYGLDVKLESVLERDLISRIRNTPQARRFVGNMMLIGLKQRDWLLWGKDFRKELPAIETLYWRDLRSELLSTYRHAMSRDKKKNIFERPPKAWCGYIINMSDALLVVKEIFIKKQDIPAALEKIYPDFPVIDIVRQALAYRAQAKTDFSWEEKKFLKQSLKEFLNEFKRVVKTF
jgi:predicted nucleotidyltransferase